LDYSESFYLLPQKQATYLSCEKIICKKPSHLTKIREWKLQEKQMTINMTGLVGFKTCNHESLGKGI
jgi:hypothetical protein